MQTSPKRLLPLFTLLLGTFLGLGAGCGNAADGSAANAGDIHGATAERLVLPALAPAPLQGAPLRAVASTSIIGDVVAHVGGDSILLTTLMGDGQDPHSYQPAARDLTAVAEANVVFVNGWNLEEALVEDLESIAGAVPVIAVSAGIEPLRLGDHEPGDAAGNLEAEEEHATGSADPHTWLSVPNVEQWVANIEQVLSELDPAGAATYRAQAEVYLEQLDALDAYAREQLALVPAGQRYLVTNHDSLAYFAQEYGFEVIGTVIPAASTLAEPSASAVANLIQTMGAYGICTLFTEATVSDALAQTVASELSDCPSVRVMSLYTGAVGPAGSGADSYVSMFRANVDVVVAGLAP